RVDLPAPLRPTTPMRSPVETPSDTESSSGRSLNALLIFSALIRFTMSGSRHDDPEGTMVTPGTGAAARPPPAPDSATARSPARSAFAARKTQVGPDPATIAPSAPSSWPAFRVL